MVSDSLRKLVGFLTLRCADVDIACSLKWVDDVHQAVYEEILNNIRTILSGLEPMDTASGKSLTSSFKPALESFSSVLDNKKAIEELNMSIGKSISFDAAQYHHHFGVPRMPVERSPSPTRVIASQTTSWDARVSPSRHQLDARRDQHHQSLVCRQQSPPSSPSRLHLSSATPKLRPMSSSSSSRATKVRHGILISSSAWKNDESRTNRHFLLTGKSALSPVRLRTHK